MSINNLVDFHCHLDLYPDFNSAVMKCEREGVQTLSVTTTPKAWPRNYELIKRTHYIRSALGLHPQLVSQRANELQLWKTYLPQTRYVGEVGLDAGPRFYKSLDLQKEVFSKILDFCNNAGEKIITVHSTRASSVVLDMIEKYLPSKQCRVVLHWFSGTKSEAERAIEIGCYFSINAEMFKKEALYSTVSTLSIDRILTETDGPFCQYKGAPIYPINVINTVGLLANMFSKTVDEMRMIILSNLKILEAF
jgi:TatD DNase family protein